MWDPLVISLFLLCPPRAERSSCARPAGFPFPSISLLRPPNLDSSCGNVPRHPLHLPKPLDRLLTAGILPHHRRTPLELLEALLDHRSASPVVLRSNRPREWIRGEFLVLSGLFPFCGVSPAPVDGHRHRRRICTGQKLGIADGPPGRSGQSAGQFRFRPETMLLLVV